MTKTIEKKIWPEFFEEDQIAKFDLRLADFDLEENDTIKFREWDPEKEEYTGREFTRKVKFIEKFNTPLRFWSKKELEERGLYLIEMD